VFGEASARGEATITDSYRSRKATLTSKLNAHDEAMYEHLINIYGEATLAAMLNARDKAGI